MEFQFGEYATRIRFTGPGETLPGTEDGPALHVYDRNTRSVFPASGAPSVTLAPGEGAKNWESVDAILSGALEAKLARDGRIVGTGGGVVCDMAAFASSLYMRGCRLTLVPTTLLAMVDASLGGKTGIDYGGYKNLVGTFYPAEELRICIGSLRTLPEREFLSGLAEVIKTAMLGDPELFLLLEHSRDHILAREDALLKEIVERCLRIKGGLVEADLRETGVRAYLNLGHTFAHALETATGFSGWTHGEAVAWGCIMAMRTGVLLGLTDPGYAERVERLFAGYGYRTRAELPPDSLVAAMGRDKKRRGGALRLVLQRGAGDTFTMEAEEELVRTVLQRQP